MEVNGVMETDPRVKKQHIQRFDKELFGSVGDKWFQLGDHFGGKHSQVSVEENADLEHEISEEEVQVAIGLPGGGQGPGARWIFYGFLPSMLGHCSN
jgi:hypothetical protein